MGTTVVIKGIDEKAYRRLKGEAMRTGLKVGEAASQAFRLWVQQRMPSKARDIERLRRACQRMDENRSKLRVLEDWSSVKVIRQWREHPRS